MTASLENCKKLYELSGWGELESYYDDNPTFPMPVCPKYNAGYLLRRLQKPGKPVVMALGERWRANTNHYALKYIEAVADTPEDACCLLLIKLIEEKVIKL